MKYFVTIAERTIEVELRGDRVVVEGRELPAELREIPGIPVRNLLVGQLSWMVPMEPAGPGRWLVQRRGDRFEVEVVDERTQYIRSLVGGGRSHAGVAALRAPMPGLVIRVLPSPGQAVEAGQGLVVLEAMKMENELRAAGPGVVDQVLAKPGQAVEKGTVLITFRQDEGAKA